MWFFLFIFIFIPINLSYDFHDKCERNLIKLGYANKADLKNTKNTWIRVKGENNVSLVVLESNNFTSQPKSFVCIYKKNSAIFDKIEVINEDITENFKDSTTSYFNPLNWTR